MTVRRKIPNNILIYIRFLFSGIFPACQFLPEKTHLPEKVIFMNLYKTMTYKISKIPLEKTSNNFIIIFL